MKSSVHIIYKQPCYSLWTFLHHKVCEVNWLTHCTSRLIKRM